MLQHILHLLTGMGSRLPLGVPKTWEIPGQLSFSPNYGTNCKCDECVRPKKPGNIRFLHFSYSVQDDIVESLKMDKTRMFSIIHPFNRDNLFYETRYHGPLDQAEHMGDIHQLIANMHQRRGRPSSGIVYCRLRTACDELSDFLRKKGINARPYHRGLK